MFNANLFKALPATPPNYYWSLQVGNISNRPHYVLSLMRQRPFWGDKRVETRYIEPMPCEHDTISDIVESAKAIMYVVYPEASLRLAGEYNTGPISLPPTTPTTD